MILNRVRKMPQEWEEQVNCMRGSCYTATTTAPYFDYNSHRKLGGLQPVMPSHPYRTVQVYSAWHEVGRVDLLNKTVSAELVLHSFSHRDTRICYLWLSGQKQQARHALDLLVAETGLIIS